MSTRIPVAPNLGLLFASLNRDLQHALAFRRAHSVRALDAPRARVLQPHARADTLAPTALARSAEPCRALPFSLLRAKQPPPRPAGQALAAAAARQPCAVQRRPSLARSPPGPWSSASSSASVSASPRRRHVALATERRFAGELIHGRRGTALPRYKREAPSVSKPSGSPCRLTSAPIVTNWKGEGLLQPLRSVRPPLPPGSIRRNQSFPLSNLFTRSLLCLP